ncbi:MAG: hypothetical protein LKF79_03220 [Solobacterium sp.]|nr:hypothetical protein [Solobacterium sp.]MCH4222321.1 hypothetical protein [Solobacterium sp.]MCH4265638.1 hypothetical protein [Solobacterium sp.]
MKTKKIGGIMFLVGSIAGILLSLFVKNIGTTIPMILALVALVGIIMTKSSGVWLYLLSMVVVYVGAKGWIPGGSSVNNIVTIVGQVIQLVAIIFCWKDAVKDALK